MSKQATELQKLSAAKLKIKVTSQSERVLAAQIIDRTEDDALKLIETHDLKPGVKVRYKYGGNTDLTNRVLTIAKTDAFGFVFFKGTKAKARPHLLFVE